MKICFLELFKSLCKATLKQSCRCRWLKLDLLGWIRLSSQIMSLQADSDWFRALVFQQASFWLTLLFQLLFVYRSKPEIKLGNTLSDIFTHILFEIHMVVMLFLFSKSLFFSFLNTLWKLECYTNQSKHSADEISWEDVVIIIKSNFDLHQIEGVHSFILQILVCSGHGLTVYLKNISSLIRR